MATAAMDGEEEDNHEQGQPAVFRHGGIRGHDSASAGGADSAVIIATPEGAAANFEGDGVGGGVHSFGYLAAGGAQGWILEGAG